MVLYNVLVQEGSPWLIHKIQVSPSPVTFLPAISHPPHTVATKSISLSIARLIPIAHTSQLQSHLACQTQSKEDLPQLYPQNLLK
jgi:hypothetical protein